MSTNPVLGVYMITRHGDRFGFYQDPTTYTAKGTAISTLGETQLYNLGAAIRSRYFTTGSANVVAALAADNGLYNPNQVYIRADAGGEGGVIYDSAVALTQGLWSPTSLSNNTLADGTTVTSPLGGYQYVPIESVEPEQDISLEGWTECNAFTSRTTKIYQSASFNQTGSAYLPYLQYLNSTNLLGAQRKLSLANGYNIFDYVNVESIHNASFVAAINATADPSSIVPQARALGNWHEYTLFSDADGNGIGNIAGRTVLPNIFKSLVQFTNSSSQLRFAYDAVSYKPFISLFNMTDVIAPHPDLAGIVDYASALTLEVRSSGGAVNSSCPGSGYLVRMNFRNGTVDSDFRTLNMFGSDSVDYPLDQFISRLQPYSISTLDQWCSLCDTTTARGCDAIASANAIGSHYAVSPVAAGFIGAGVTIALFAVLLTLAGLLGLVGFGNRRKRPAVVTRGSEDGSHTVGSSSSDFGVGEKAGQL